MHGRLYKNMGFSLMPFAFLLLFEPSWSLLDPLPDFIGYFLLCMSIINLADINPRISEAFCGFRKACVLSIARFASMLLVNKHFASGEQTMGSLIFVFVFAVFEITVLLPAYKNLFEGLLSLGIFYDGEAVHRKKSGRSANLTEKLYALTVFFVIAKTVVCALPEFTGLISHNPYEFLTILRAIAVILVTPLSVVWLVKTLSYCKQVRADKSFISNLAHAYLERAESTPQFYTLRVLTVGLTALSVSIILSIDFYSDNINLIPDFLFYATVLLCAIYIKEYSPKWKWTAVTATVGVLISVAVWLSTKSFFAQYYPNAIRKDLGAYYAYYSMLALYIVESVVFIVTVALVLLIIRDIYKNHTDIVKAASQKEYALESRKFKACGIVCSVMTVLSGLGNIYYVWALPFYDNGRFFSYSAMISGAINIIFAFAVCYLISSLKDSVKHNYRMYT